MKATIEVEINSTAEGPFRMHEVFVTGSAGSGKARAKAMATGRTEKDAIKDLRAKVATAVSSVVTLLIGSDAAPNAMVVVADPDPVPAPAPAPVPAARGGRKKKA